jgi:hypothetical protein
LVRFWTLNFAAALALLVLFVVLAVPVGLATNPQTGDPAPLLPPTVTGSGVASLAFLLLFIYAISHAGGWVMGKFRDRGKPEPQEAPKGRRGRARPAKERD